MHSLCVTRVFHAAVDEQLIMGHTGHQSTDGVRRYKQTSYLGFSIFRIHVGFSNLQNTLVYPLQHENTG